MLANNAYSHPSARRLLRRRGIRHCIPERRGQRERRTHPPGRKPRFGAATYKRRNVVERCINRPRQFRGPAARYDRRAGNDHAFVILASLELWLPGD